jgi:hypothetical protein
MKRRLTNQLALSILLRLAQSVVRGLHTLDHILRRERTLGGSERISDSPERGMGANSPSNHGRFLSVPTVAAVVMVCGPCYGLAMGSYASIVGHRTISEQLPQMIYSATKVPLLILLTLLVSIPSFFVINSLMGLRDDFMECLRAIVSAQAGLTIILASLLPLTLFAYVSLGQSETSYSAAVLLNALTFGAASISAQLLLRGYYRPLVLADRRHRWMIRFWIVVYAFVGIQAAYILRPFIGNPHQPPQFLRRESFENAYVKILELVGNLLHEI